LRNAATNGHVGKGCVVRSRSEMSDGEVLKRL
jgi:hypothetical protein